MSGIYNIRNIVNDKVYIGSAVSFKLRWNCHQNDLLNNRHVNNKLQNSYNKYGKDSFVYEIIEYVDNKTQLIEREQVWLDFFKPEYNIAKIAGSTLGIKCSDEKKLKISIANKGKKRSSETIAKRLLSDKCMKHSDETKAKMSLAKQNISDELRVKLSIAGTGRKHSDESKLKMSLAQKGRIVSDETKAKISLTLKRKKNNII